jgi:myosin-1
MAFHWTSKSSSSSSAGVEDMVLLSKVTEEQIVENLRKRYQNDLIYTYIGPTLVAVNPYKQLPYFTQKEIDMYRGAASHENAPHIYATADTMFQNMMTDEENQCVIISGESGAGKTESAKLIMNYIAAVSDRGGSGNNIVEQVKNIILGSNPLLESFGNAKTLRNNNSSRFGKYFEIRFLRGGQPVGGNISNFLLEKSRVVSPGKGERNFHIFYQLTKNATEKDKTELGLSAPNNFNYLNCSGTYDADGIDDTKDFQDMKKSLDVCGISAEDQASLFQIVAGILHLGNIEFTEENNEAVVTDPRTLEFPAYLLGISAEALNDKLVSRLMQTGFMKKRQSDIRMTLNREQACGTRDALAKSLYSRMFDWLVQEINIAMKRLQGTNQDQILNLGVLDIYGFEIFEKNGFEQFCINYVNERLQQIFIELTLKSEQEEYVAENIQWVPIKFFNNKVVVDLIESKRPPGMMCILDDVCATMHAVSKGADEDFVRKMDQNFSNNVDFNKHYQGMQTKFLVRHYAGNVTYDCDGFCEANKDTLFRDLIILMQTTNKPFIRNLFPENVDTDDKKRPTTFSFKIKNQCHELVETLMKCTPSYVRCIKPNESKVPKDWDGKRVDHQIRYLNLKENINVRRAGFCYRQTFEKMLKRYAILTPETYPTWNGNPKDGVKHILEAVDMDKDQWQFGLTKVFIKTPESLFILEELRDRKYHGYAKTIQTCYRKWKSRKYFLDLKKQSTDIFYGKKQRRRFSINRDFSGDYINYLSNPLLKQLVGKNEKCYFASEMSKYDRKFKNVTPMEFVIGEKTIYFIGMVKEKKGPNKGKFVKVVKRAIPIDQISGISTSTLADDIIIFHLPEYDYVCENVFKTELISVLDNQYKKHTNKNLNIMISNDINYTVKKTRWSGGGIYNLQFIEDPTIVTNIEGTNGIPMAAKAMIKAKGKGAEIRMAPGLPADTKPVHKEPPPQTSYSRPTATQKKYTLDIKSNASSTPTPAASSYTPPAPAPAPSQAPTHANNPIANAILAKSQNSMVHSNPSAVAQQVKVTKASAPVNPTINQIKKRPPPTPPPKKKLPTVKAIYAYNANEADELTFNAGDIIYVISKDDSGWWTGVKQGEQKKGLFPSNYVQEN